MSNLVAKKIAAGVLALGVTGTALGATAGTAFAAAKPKPKPKATATAKPTTHLVAGIVASVDAKAHTFTLKAAKKADVFTTGPTTTVNVVAKKATVAALKAGEHVRVTYVVAGKVLDATHVLIAKA